MTMIRDSAHVTRILEDQHYRVPEADASSTGSFERFRSTVSRFANGSTHDDRRAWIDVRLARATPDALAEVAAARTRRTLADAPSTPAGSLARAVPVATLAELLGFDDPGGLPPLVAAVAERYATGIASDTAAEDSAIERLLDAAPATHAEMRAIEVQLLVQAWASTAALIDGAMRRLATDDGMRRTTAALLHSTLEHDAPVAATRRVAPDGELLVLRLGGTDLAFGAGARRCPARRHALAIAGAIVDVLRTRCDARDGAHAHPAEGVAHADAG